METTVHSLHDGAACHWHQPLGEAGWLIIVDPRRPYWSHELTHLLEAFEIEGGDLTQVRIWFNFVS